jgi:hypothetical protein
MADDISLDLKPQVPRKRILAPHYLESSGWLRSRQERMPVDAEGGPMPWYTYAAIAFLEARIDPSFCVFEYGSGNSTLWWAARTHSVNSVEHSEAWAAKMQTRLPENARVRHAPLDGSSIYANAAALSNQEYDVIVVDGVDRVRCAYFGLSALAPEGIVIWDNSDRDRYQAGYDYLMTCGFRAIAFEGLGPICVTPWRTSVFYRRRNCLGI